MLALTDGDLEMQWDRIYRDGATGAMFRSRDWTRALFGKRILEVGSGLGIGTVFYQRSGAQEGSLSSEKWGDRTDGGAPWVAWHDLEKIEYMLAPSRFDVVQSFEFHESDSNWFDLLVR